MIAKCVARPTIMLLLGLVPTMLHAAQPRLGGGGDVDVSLGRIVIALVICIIIAVLAILLIRQRGGKLDLPRLFAQLEPRPREIQVIETRRLNPHSDICLVRHADREYLLVLQHGSTQILRERDLNLTERVA
ncbi:hypothetical protein DBR17_01135 [Sphingomonas sp. HMWF008]|nr:hypothetical protein DBR17_01135 [Sphingomonas sp. HMWF008]